MLRWCKAAALRVAFFLLSALAFGPTALAAGTVPAATEQRIRAAVKDLNIEWIRPAPIAGLYEIKAGPNLFYVDAAGKYLVSGHIFDTQSRRDLTAARIQEINRIDWHELPLEKAIVSGDENGLELAVFTDPDCPYCRRLEEELRQTKGIKVYTFLFPIEQLHPQAKAKAEAIWCARDRHQALQAVMLEGKKLPEAKCATPVDDLIALGRRLHIRATPTLIARDGRRQAGLMPAAQIKEWLASR